MNGTAMVGRSLLISAAVPAPVWHLTPQVQFTRANRRMNAAGETKASSIRKIFIRTNSLKSGLRRCLQIFESGKKTALYPNFKWPDIIEAQTIS